MKLWPIAIVAIIVVLALLSFHLPLRLVTNTPQQFRAVPVMPSGKPNLELADEYWRAAVSVIQWKYPFGSFVPHDPPPDFVLPFDSLATKRRDEVARQQYWGVLRQLWSRPDVWHRRLEFDVSWTGSAVRNVFDFVSAITGHSVF